MPPKSTGSQFVFVGGPSLNEQSGNVRSTLLRRVLAEKRSKRREDAAVKLDSMLNNRGGVTSSVSCTCGAAEDQIVGTESDSPDARQTTNYRLLRPRHKQSGVPKHSGPCSRCDGPAGDAQAASDLPLALLGAGRSDPLLPVDATAKRLKVHELLDFTATTLWPHFRAQDYAGNCYKSWVFPYDNNLLVYAVLWAASYHRDIMRITYGASEPQLESKDQLELKSLALLALQHEIANIAVTKSADAVVMCILYLAVNDQHKTKIVRDPSPFSPPFVNLQALDFYGSREYHPLHWTIVQEVVQRFGGIEKLQAYALAWLLSLSDLMGAVQTLTKPIYPIMGVNGSRLDLQPPSLLFQPYNFPKATNAGFGFQELFYIWPPIKQDIVSVFMHLGQYSSFLQHFFREPSNPAVLDLLGDSRNFIHHRLLSLPDEHDTLELIIECQGQSEVENQLSREIYLTCRLSAILYAVHVTFPIPRTQMLRQIILEGLYPRVERLRDQKVSGPLMLWCVAIFISMLPERPPEPLVSYMTILCQDTGVKTLTKLVALLESFAWVTSAVGDKWKETWTSVLPP